MDGSIILVMIISNIITASDLQIVSNFTSLVFGVERLSNIYLYIRYQKKKRFQHIREGLFDTSGTINFLSNISSDSYQDIFIKVRLCFLF